MIHHIRFLHRLSVSYTHLDVYKRQLLTLINNLNKPHNHFTLQYSKFFKESEKEESVKKTGQSFMSINFVKRVSEATGPRIVDDVKMGKKI